MKQKTPVLTYFLVFAYFRTLLGGENGTGRPGRGLKSFLEVVRFILTEYEPVGSHGDRVHDYFLSHFVSKLSDFDPNRNHLLHMDAEINLRCTKCPPRSNFVTLGAPGASGFMWVAFFPTGNFPAIWGVAEKHNMSP